MTQELCVSAPPKRQMPLNDFAEYQEDLNYLFEVYTDKEVETLFILLSQLYAGIENLEKRAAMKKDREI